MGFVIAVDGPAASGKGTIAGALARHYGLAYLDTGLLYRAVGLVGSGMAEGMDLPFEQGAILVSELMPETLDHPGYRTARAGELASRAAAIPKVRQNLLAFQRQFAAQEPGAVLDGRDIGTVIVPNADVKLFVTASPQVRAERRWKQLRGQGEDIPLDEVLADIRRRDERDSHRAAAPLLQASDARLLDTSEMTIERAFSEALGLVEQARSGHR